MIRRIKDSLLKYRLSIIVPVHIFLIMISYVLAFYIRFESAPPVEYMEILLRTLPILIFIKVVIFYCFGLYSGMWRYVSMHDLVQILSANIVATVIFFFSIVFSIGLSGYPRSVFLLDWVLCVGFLSGIRFMSRWFRERVQPIRHRRSIKTLIVGAGEAGILVLKELKRRTFSDVVGFVDDDQSKVHSHIYGTKVLGTMNDIKKIVKAYDVEEIIIAIPSAGGKTIRNIVLKCEKTEVKIKTIPGLNKILTGEVAIKRIRDVRPEDLLGRETVQINTEDVNAFIRGKTVLVTGAGGTIGSELCRQIAKFSPGKLILYDHNENDTYFLDLELWENHPYLKTRTIIGDIKDAGLLKHTFSKYRPQIVFHSAAHKHVPLMEENPVAAVKNNITGTKYLVYASEHYGVESFVMISTDKAVNPTSVMGASKRIAEMMMQARARTAKTKFMAVRFGNVIGSSGSVVPIFKQQIKKGGPITVTHPEIKRFFMTASEAAQLVMQAGAIGTGGGIFILNMGEQIKIVDLARDLITLSGLELGEDIMIKFTGLRPGEKMHEEMLLDAAHDMATKHDKIYVEQPENIDARRLRGNIKVLERMAGLMDEESIIGKMKEMVPTYDPGGNGRHQNDDRR